MIALVLHAWIIMFIALFVCFFVLQPKIWKLYLHIKNNYAEQFESCRPSFFLAKYNEQLVFLIFMYKKKYKSLSDEVVIMKADKLRNYILANFFATLTFLAITIVILVIGWTGNL